MSEKIIVMTESELIRFFDERILPMLESRQEKTAIIEVEKQKPISENLTRKEAADFLRVSEPTLDRWVTSGKVKKRFLYGSPRFKRTELEKLLK